VVDGDGAVGEALGDGLEADQLPPPSSWAPDPKWSRSVTIPARQ
jgi:hypothetical protein